MPFVGPAAGQATGSTLPAGINQAKARFAVLVSKGTGLTLASVLAWMRAEGGPTGNPLNIGPGKDYGNADAAATATVALLHTQLYKPVIDAAKAAPSNTKAQLQAIAESPWDAGHYTGSQNGKPTPGIPWGTTLIGALKSIGDNSVKTAASQGSVDTATDTGKGLLSGVGNVFGGLANWIQGQASTALAYVVLTTLGLALVVFGLLEVFGVNPVTAITGARPKPGAPGSSQLAAGDTLPF